MIASEGQAFKQAPHLTHFSSTTCHSRSSLQQFDGHMFFLGAAFALLEVKALTTFALLFGSTWIVNSLVFFAILLSVLLAVLLNARFQFKRIWIVYVLLFAMLAVNLAVRPETLILGNIYARYFVASILIFAPVFLANVVFSNSFRDTARADISFASNLLGIMTGGMLEYFSMLIGYHMLLWFVIAFYALATVLRLSSFKSGARVAGSLPNKLASAKAGSLFSVLLS